MLDKATLTLKIINKKIKKSNWNLLEPIRTYQNWLIELLKSNIDYMLDSYKSLLKFIRTYNLSKPIKTIQNSLELV